MKTPKTYPQTRHEGGSQYLEKNDVWNVPADTDEVRGEMETRGMYGTISKYRALAMDMDGFVYGVRSLSNPKESGHQLEGTVSIDGKKHTAFTSSTLFRRADGSLCDVATIYVRKGDAPIPLPDLDFAAPEVLEELVSRYFYNRDDSRALIRDYARNQLDILSGKPVDRMYSHIDYIARREEIYAKLPDWAKSQFTFRQSGGQVQADPERCHICGRVMHASKDMKSVDDSLDCGGDCWGCVRQIEENMKA